MVYKVKPKFSKLVIKKAAGRESCDKQLAQRVQVRLVPRRASYKRRQKKIKAEGSHDAVKAAIHVANSFLFNQFRNTSRAQKPAKKTASAHQARAKSARRC